MTFLAWALILAPCFATTTVPPGLTEPGFSVQSTPIPASAPAAGAKSKEVGTGTGSGPAPGGKAPSWAVPVAAPADSWVKTPSSGVAAAPAPGTLARTMSTTLWRARITLGTRPVALKSRVPTSGTPAGTGRLAVSTSGSVSSEKVAGTWKLEKGRGSGVVQV